MSAVTLQERAVSFRYRGRIADLDAASRRALLDRITIGDELVEKRTADIIRSVRIDGDAALYRLARELDGVELRSLAVGKDPCTAALRALEPDLRLAMERARRNIATVHRAFHPAAMEVASEPGVVIGRRPDPLDSAGIYAPGGRAAYPSSLLMGAVAARAAGVRRVVVCSPPGRDGLPSQVVLAAAALAGVDEVYAIGGAGAVAAMAFGTESLERVDLIVGPGNAYVTEAKQQVARVVGTDTPAGPSELLVIADDSANATVVAREVVAQAEHDPRAVVVVTCIGLDVQSRIESAIAELVPGLDREAIVREALANNGAILEADSDAEALAFACGFAPEHLLLTVASERERGLLAQVRNAGTVFLGAQSSVAFGDYMTGANHVLPTGGIARFRSGLSPFDFIRWTTWQRVGPDAAASLASDVALFAEAEGLPAHAAAARQWERA